MAVDSVVPEIDVFNLPVFADAAIFPMIPPDELAELADDIKENGLNEPLVIGKIYGEWMLVDGRNRLAACRLAGIEPHVRVLEGDPKAYVLSANINRRHMTKGQRAMAVARMYPEPEKGGRGNKINSSKNEDFKKISTGNLSQARTIIAYAPDFVDSVISGAVSLSDAYKEAKARKEDAESEESRFAELQAQAPDLSDLVKEERMTLPEADRILKGRLKADLETAKNQRAVLFGSLSEAVFGAKVFSFEGHAQEE